MQAINKISDGVIKYYINLLKTKGKEEVYKNAVNIGLKALGSELNNPDLELLNTSESFLLLYRRTGRNEYLILSNILRRSANCLYRQILRLNPDKPKNSRFLNIVK